MTDSLSPSTDGRPGTAAGKPPGPDGLPFVGNVRTFAADPLSFVTSTAREYGPIANYRVGPYEIYQLSDPDLVKQVLVDRNERYVKGEVFDRTLEPVLGQGLLTSEGAFWREHRHRLEPAFHPDQISAAGSVMTDYAERFLADWTDGETRNVHADMMELTVEIAARALFDVDIRESEDDIGEALTVVMDHVSNRMGYPVEVPLWLPTPGNRRYRAAIETLHGVADRIVDEYDRGPERDEGDVRSLLLDGPGRGRVASRDAGPAARGGEDGSADGTGDGHTAPDGPFPREQASDEIVTLLLAGHETTALSLTYACHLLGRYPGAAASLRAELDDVLGGRSPTVEDLPDLPYTEQVVQESMRLYPPVWELIRESVTNDRVGGYRVPAGATVSMHQWVLHRDPRFWDDPLAFRPERWSEEATADRPAFAYFPFGGGPRRCIGDRFAMLEARLVLATVAREWAFEPLDELSFSPSITLRPDGPVEMTVRRR
ncbi:MAG: cytochrome P450 [Haloarculaceae archaeon]